MSLLIFRYYLVTMAVLILLFIRKSFTEMTYVAIKADFHAWLWLASLVKPCLFIHKSFSGKTLGAEKINFHAWLLLAILVQLCGFIPISALAGPSPPSDATTAKEAPQAVMSLVKIIATDLAGRPLAFPANVTAEPDQQELYVINSGTGQIIIYDKDFAPHFTLGAGRGIDGPQCVFFDHEKSRVFIGQHATNDKGPCLTILNAAFLPEQEVPLPTSPDGNEFSPANGAVATNGKIYLAGTNSRFILVLNNNASFSHWFQVLDHLIINKTKTTDSHAKRQQRLAQIQQEGNTSSLLPDILRPQRHDNLPRNNRDAKGMEGVFILDIAANSEGHLFFLSEETSKIYVYNPGEKFLFSFGEKGGSSTKMSRPRGLALDEHKKCIYVVDYMRHTILVYNMAGRFLFEFGGRGHDPLWFNFPNAIAVDGQGRVVIADLFNNRVQVLHSDFRVSYPVFGNTKDVAPKPLN